MLDLERLYKRGEWLKVPLPRVFRTMKLEEATFLTAHMTHLRKSLVSSSLVLSLRMVACLVNKARKRSSRGTSISFAALVIRVSLLREVIKGDTQTLRIKQQIAMSGG